MRFGAYLITIVFFLVLSHLTCVGAMGRYGRDVGLSLGLFLLFFVLPWVLSDGLSEWLDAQGKRLHAARLREYLTEQGHIWIDEYDTIRLMKRVGRSAWYVPDFWEASACSEWKFPSVDNLIACHKRINGVRESGGELPMMFLWASLAVIAALQLGFRLRLETEAYATLASVLLVLLVAARLLRARLKRRGIHWMTTGDCLQLVLRYRRRAFRLPPHDELALIPGWREYDPESFRRILGA